MKMNKQYKELLTYSEYAELKKISLKTVYNHVKNGLIVPVVIGKAKFIRYENK